MRNFYYTKSPELFHTIGALEALRRDLLTTAISPKDELICQWDAYVDRIFYGLQIKKLFIDKQKIIDIIATSHKRSHSTEEKEVIAYKRALDYVEQNWKVSSDNPTLETILQLGNFFNETELVTNLNDLKDALRYIQVQPEHPIIQAALAFSLIMIFSPFKNYNQQVAFLFTLLFLYKYNFDFRNLIVLEKFLTNDSEKYSHYLGLFIRMENLTTWIEFFVKKTQESMTDVRKSLIEKTDQPIMPYNFYDLTERQQKILTYLKNPNLSINNRKVQELFHVSQITAARDLSKLNSLRLVLAIGAGRSIHYVKN